MTEVINHKCPFCGGSLEFDIGSQMVKCPYCDNEFNPNELKKNEGDLTVSDEQIELAEDGGSEWDDAELYGISEYQCKTCGGNLYTDETTSATICPYCGNAVMLKGRLSGSLKPDLVIPFQKTKEQALQGLEDHCRSKWFVAKAYKENNKLEEVKGLYVPFWVYDADLDADVTYNCVDERTWRSGNTEYTERKYYKVRRAGDIAFDHVPADGSSKMPDDLMESIEPFDHNKSVDFTTAYLSGYVADKYDVDQETVRPRVRKRMAEGAADAFASTVHYDEVSVENSSITAKSSTVNYTLYPVWLLSTQWKDQMFMFAMNGQTGKMVGNLPMDKLRMGSAVAGLFGAFLLIGLLLFLFVEDFEVGGFLTVVMIGLIVAGIFFYYFQSQLKSVQFKHGASDYYREGSMNLKVKEDTFLYKRTTSRRLND
jgi:DNA-directed RNA polymerase subunit RPC12/RpoP